MSGRGRGRGRGGGRGQPRSDQPPPPSGRGGGRGHSGRGGRGPAAPYEAAPPLVRPPPPATTSPPSGSGASSSHYPTLPVGAPSSLSGDFQQRLTMGSRPTSVQPITPPAPQPPVPQPSAQPSPSSSKALGPPARPDFGRVGQKIMIRANHFFVQASDRDLHQYDVSIAPEVSSKKVCRDIMSTLIDSYRDSHLGKRLPAYDGRKSIYSSGPLPFTSKDFVVKLRDKDEPARREREFMVTIRFAAKADLHHLQQFLQSRQRDIPQETLQALDVVLRATPSANYTVVGRSFFSPILGDKGSLGDGVDYWLGFYQSLRATQMGLSLNVDMSARPFYEPVRVTEFVAKYLNIRDLNNKHLSDQERIKVKKVLRGIRVELTHLENIRRSKISSLSQQPTSQLMFSVDDADKRISVVQYYRQKYNVVLKFPSLPALQTGSDSRPVYLPMELCKIVEGQRYTKKLNERQVSNLLRATCQRPNAREQSIKQMVVRNNYNTDKFANEFGLKISAELATVDARVLQPPTLKYQGTEEVPRVGAWNMINKKMYNGGRVDFWTCVSFSKMKENEVFRFCDELIGMCQSKGMSFNPDPILPIHTAHSGRIEKALIDIHSHSTERLATIGHSEKHLQLLIIILPDFTGSYGKIKRICETELGIISQCCQPRQAIKLSKQYLENVSLKINVKAGGRNAVLTHAVERRIPKVSDRPTIIFGADVTHPSPGEDSSPSIAAVVASMDWPEVTKYRGLVSAQPHREEIISDLFKTVDDPKRGPVASGMVRELLIAFRRSTGFKPHRIIFYRDGVSEGQFNQVLLYEMDAIRKACSSLEENYLPPVTFVVVQKRHHTRLFPMNHNDRNSTDRSGNILPGTVVDTKICHPRDFDFYLCSHAGIQGTSRPTHYHVLYDENNFSADALQGLTNNLCYTYARCTRSVSIVPPAYYAHLAAFRARYYVEGDVSDSGSTSGAKNTREKSVEVRALPVIKDNVKDVMFYC